MHLIGSRQLSTTGTLFWGKPQLLIHVIYAKIIFDKDEVTSHVIEFASAVMLWWHCMMIQYENPIFVCVVGLKPAWNISYELTERQNYCQSNTTPLHPSQYKLIKVTYDWLSFQTSATAARSSWNVSFLENIEMPARTPGPLSALLLHSSPSFHVKGLYSGL